MPAHGGYPERPRAQGGARPHKAAERRVAKRRAKLRVVSSGPRLGPVSRESSAPLRVHGPEGGGGSRRVRKSATDKRAEGRGESDPNLPPPSANQGRPRRGEHPG